MNPCPAILFQAHVVLWAVVTGDIQPTGKTMHRMNGQVVGPAAGLAICQADDSGCLLFYCNSEWEYLTDTWHASLEAAKSQAEFEYAGISAAWRAVSA